MGDAWIASIKARVDFLNSVLAQKNISAVFVLSALAIVNVAIIVVIAPSKLHCWPWKLGWDWLKELYTFLYILPLQQEPTAKSLNSYQLK